LRQGGKKRRAGRGDMEFGLQEKRGGGRCKMFSAKEGESYTSSWTGKEKGRATLRRKARDFLKERGARPPISCPSRKGEEDWRGSFGGRRRRESVLRSVHRDDITVPSRKEKGFDLTLLEGKKEDVGGRREVDFGAEEVLLHLCGVGGKALASSICRPGEGGREEKFPEGKIKRGGLPLIEEKPPFSCPKGRAVGLPICIEIKKRKKNN